MLEPQISQLIIPYQEYAQRHLGQLCPTLDIYRKEEQAFYYLGVAHSRDPQHQQWEFIEAQWRRFLQNTGSRRLAFTESGTTQSLDSKIEAIKKHGEAGLVCNLAAKSDVRVFCLEPPFQQQYEYLSQRFYDDEIFFFYFLRQAAFRRHLRPDIPELRSYMEPHIERDRRRFPHKEHILNYDYLVGLSDRLFGYSFPEDVDQELELSDPTKTTTITNRVANSLSVSRNQHIVSEIIRVWQSGNSMFAVYGAAHPVVQEPALRVALQ
jgi:hypothetical protein